jgi:hypothetical protein
MLPSITPTTGQSAVATERRLGITSTLEPHPQNDTETVRQPGQRSLDDLPPEIVHEIAEYLRIEQRKIYNGDCSCDEPTRPTAADLELIDLSTAAPGTWLDSSWAFSCVSRRYRGIVFHGNRGRMCSLAYSTCCIKRAMAIPNDIRASVS